MIDNRPAIVHPTLTSAVGGAAFGSLTTFNILFEDKEDQFVGQKGE